MIKDSLREEMKATMKSGDARLLEVIRFLLAQLQTKEKEKQAQGKDPALTDDEVIAVFQKEAKKRRESIEMFKKGGREDLVKKEEFDLGVIEKYLPKAMDQKEIVKIIDDLIAGGAHDFNLLMKETMKKVAGRADGKTISEIIKAKL